MKPGFAAGDTIDILLTGDYRGRVYVSICWVIVGSGNFFEENLFQNVVCKLSAISFGSVRPEQNGWHTADDISTHRGIVTPYGDTDLGQYWLG